MYLSHPVRRMRDDPGDETATLVVEFDAEEDAATLTRAVAGADGEVVRELPFDCWLVRLPEADVEMLCELAGITRIETAATLERGVDETVVDGMGDGPAADDGESWG
ncbi:MAG: hypothetical protein ACOCTH_00230 [Halodesulfurarchaeum sp.]